MSGPRAIVLGSGIVGEAAVWDLVRRGHEVIVADVDADAAERVAANHGATGRSLDVTDDAAIHDAADDVDAIVSAVPYVHGVRLAQLAIDVGAHYADFGGNPSVVTRQIRLDEAARNAGIAVVPDCGLAPGLANVLGEDLISALDPGPIDSVQLRVGALPNTPTGALGYQLAFSPAGLINEYAEPCDVLLEGQLGEVEPLARFELIEWGDRGTLEAFSTAGGTSTMPHHHVGRVRFLEYKTLRYPGHGSVFAAIRALGLFDESPQPTADGPVAPRSVLLSALDRSLPRGAPDVVLVRVWADQGDRRLTIEIEDLHDGRFSALARTTAFPATALVDLLVKGEIDTKGVVPMHRAVTGAQLLPELAKVGIVPRSI